MNWLGKFHILLLGIITLLLTSCSGLGPATVDRDRYDYTDAIAQSWKRQMLLNMVKLRYADAPVFLDVSSIINQYLMESEVSGSLGWNTFLPEPSQNVGARSRYADRPTITYQPMMGEKFTRSLMTPITPEAIMSLVEAGWRADVVFRISTQSINGIYNSVAGRVASKPADAEFYPLLEGISKIQDSQAVGIRITKAKGQESAGVLFFRKDRISQDIVDQQVKVREMLGLDPDETDFKLVYGSFQKDDKEIAILSRSMLTILQELGAYIDVPAKHIEEKRAMGNLAKKMDADAGVKPMMAVHSSKDKPDDAFVKVNYADHWFWIDNKDFISKKLFSFLMFMFTLAESGAPSQGPVLTIPTG